MALWGDGVRRVLLVACLAAALAGTAGPQAPGAVAPGSFEGATLKRYCLGCHNSTLRTAGLALDALRVENPGEHAEAWEKVLRRLRTRFMPPAGLPRPEEATYEKLVVWLESSLDKAAADRPDPGRTDTFRRLNRTEYQNAIRDLLDVEVDVTSLLPADESGHGFDNVTVANLSPLLLERYLSAARRISRLALGRPGRAPGGESMQLPPDLTQEEHFPELPLGTRGGAAYRYTFPVDADYEVQIRLARDRNEHVEGLSEAHEVELLLDGERLRVFTVRPPPSGSDHSSVDWHLKARVPVKAGPHALAVTFPKRPSTLLETERQPYQAHFNMDRHPRIQPAVYSVTVNGPFDPRGAGDTPSRRRILICRPPGPAQEDACAERILGTLLRRAYRRPVHDADLRAPMKFYREARTEGGFEAGIEMALRAVLVSPEFLFRTEPDPPGVPPGTAYPLGGVQLASRLAFFLWSSLPDDELLDAIDRGELDRPAGLERQARRMLADPRSRNLVRNFAGQWLQLRNLASLKPDMRVFPDFDDNLRQAFQIETELLFESILREDGSVLDLIRADYTFLNQRLAKHYEIPHIYGSRFRRVPLHRDSQRGGILRHGSVLSLTSYATRTSPVLRGKWILENLLGVTPPPPPPAVPALSENQGGGKRLSVRERMAQHRANPACSGCHQLMDPAGFSMENYDAVGRWRTMEESRPVDVTGGLPDGSRFEGVAGLQQALLRRPELFVTTLTEKLLTYALGRGVGYQDAPAVRRIVREARGADYRLSSIILGIIRSPQFRMRRSQ